MYIHNLVFVFIVWLVFSKQSGYINDVTIVWFPDPSRVCVFVWGTQEGSGNQTNVTTCNLYIQ